VLTKTRRRKDLEAFLDSVGLGGKPMAPQDHHLCHAACAYYHRPWQRDDKHSEISVYRIVTDTANNSQR